MVSVETAARSNPDTQALDWREKLSRSLLRSSAMLHLAGILVYLIFGKAWSTQRSLWRC
jgi:hypothetical protein